MLPERILLLALLIACIGTAPIETHAQIFNAPRTLDPVTQQTLNELQRKPVTPSSVDEIESLVMRVVNGSGYIQELATIYYRLANGDTRLDRVVGFYMTIIEQWPRSAWAQKSIIALVPLLEMSEGELGREHERALWQHSDDLLSLSDDAATIGESASQLRNEAWRHLVHFAHLMNDAGQVQALMNDDAAVDNPHRNEAELAFRSVQIRNGSAPNANEILRAWIAANPSTLLTPFAYLLLLDTEASYADQNEIIQIVEQTYPGSLEAKSAQRFRRMQR